jgi:hypothetical protein
MPTFCVVRLPVRSRLRTVLTLGAEQVMCERRCSGQHHGAVEAWGRWAVHEHADERRSARSFRRQCPSRDLRTMRRADIASQCLEQYSLRRSRTGDVEHRSGEGLPRPPVRMVTVGRVVAWSWMSSIAQLRTIELRTSGKRLRYALFQRALPTHRGITQYLAHSTYQASRRPLCQFESTRLPV